MSRARSLCLTLCLCACTRERPNIILLSLDTTRADRTSLYGYDKPTTPHLADFGKSSTRFDLAYAPMSCTGPTHATMFTGLYPLTHGLISNGRSLSPDKVTLAELLQRAGFQTAGVVGSFVMNRKFGFAQGFESYQDSFLPEHATFKAKRWLGSDVSGGFDATANNTTDRAIRWLEESRSSLHPFFLFVHYFDPHEPYRAPPAYRKRFAHPYDAEIAFMDAEIGRLLEKIDALGLMDDSLIIVTADHGQGLMQHGDPYHNADVYEESVRVPLIFHWPGKIRSQTITGPVELVDLVPTILDAAQVTAEVDESEHLLPWQGRSLSYALYDGGVTPTERSVFLHRQHYNPGKMRDIAVNGSLFGIRRGGWKYVVGEGEGRKELYDLTTDPREQKNLVAEHPTIAAELSDRLTAWRQSAEGAASPAALTSEDKEALEALGYIQ